MHRHHRLGRTRQRLLAQPAQTPLLFDSSGNKKAAYTSVLAALNAATPAASTTSTTSAASSSSSASTSSSPSSGTSSSSSASTTTGTCRVTYAMSSWSTGFTTAITIANTSTSAISGWSLGFTLPSGQTITSGWNATYSPTSGSVTATNVSYNGTISANGSVGIGFQATHTGDTSKPTSFTLNGTACSVA